MSKFLNYLLDSATALSKEEMQQYQLSLLAGMRALSPKEIAERNSQCIANVFTGPDTLDFIRPLMDDEPELVCWERDEQIKADIYNGLVPSLEGENNE